VKGPPVVLIHGALRSRAGMWPTALALRRLGFDARVFGYATRRAGLDQHARELVGFIDRWQGARPWPVLGIVTHSMGGLVARAYLGLEEARAQSVAQRLVMIAPPNRGAHLAGLMRGWAPFHWIYGHAAAELQPDRVARLATPPVSTDVLLIAGGRPSGDRGYLGLIPGNNDGLVGIAETRIDDRPELEPELVPSSHSWLQWRPRVIRRAAAFLGGEGDGR
jgi:pimeloyl-ACP methyl ester carboxylesterase